MWIWGQRKESESPTRASRLEVAVSAHYRQPGEFGWKLGRTQNVSRSGVLLRVERPVGVNTPLETMFVVPEGLGPEAGQLATCRGSVVRLQKPSPENPRVGLGVKFKDFQVMHKPGDW